jgi:excisionase family DNA binding protein
MKREILQIENISAEDFKNELIKGVVLALKDLIFPVQNIDKDKLLTRQETSKMLSVSLVTLSVWDKKNIIQSYRIGKLVRYKKSDVLKALIKKNILH